MTELSFYHGVVVAWLVLAALAFVSLSFVTAPYGRYAGGSKLPTVHRTLGWVVMESPVVFGFALLYLVGDRRGSPAAIAFLLLWEVHYVHRTFVFPFRMRGGQLRMPISIVGSAIFFNLGNAYLQGRWLFTLGPERSAAWLAEPRFLIGTGLFLAGFAVNLHSDGVLRNLRAPRETGYKIPHGGLFRWVSCPNYLGELIEWTGWAILTWSLPGVVFAVWTAANLVPRAVSHHRWYRREFPTYPANRRALLPFVL